MRGLVFKADRRLYHSTQGVRVIQRKKKCGSTAAAVNRPVGRGFDSAGWQQATFLWPKKLVASAVRMMVCPRSAEGT